MNAAPSIYVVLCCLSGLIGQAVRGEDEVQPPAGAPATDISRAPSDGPAFTIKRRDGCVVVRGLSPRTIEMAKRASWTRDQWSELFCVKVAAAADDAPAMLGDYEISADSLKFVPRFPPAPGVTYRATFRPDRLPGAKSGDAPSMTLEFTAAVVKPAAPTVVTAVYPTSSVLPENQLKFYIHFSAPMSRGESYRRVRLLDDTGERVEYPFLELGEELWDPAGKRFTLFFDPGRIKRGLRPRELFGPALEEGRKYTLVVDQRWLDATGNPLQDSFRKEFTVTSPDDKQPSVKNWIAAAPPANTTDPLRVTFGEPLDHAMLERVLIIVDGRGRRLDGAVAVGKQETEWRFHPTRPWRAGEYALVIDMALEDRAGNSLGRPFEVDSFEQVDQQVKSETVSFLFRIKSPPAPRP